MNSKYLKNLIFIGVLLFTYILVLLIVVVLVPKGADFHDYSIFFDGRYGERFGTGFKVLISFLKSMYIEELLVVWFLIASFNIFTKIYIVYHVNKNNTVIFILLYLLSYFLLHESIQLRASIGLTLVFLSIFFYSKGQYITGLLAWTLAITFHSSLIIFISVFAVIFFLKKKILLVGYVFAIMIALYFKFYFDVTVLSVLNPLVIDYVNNVQNTKFKLTSISLILSYIFIFFGILNYRKADYFGKIVFNLYVLLMIIVFALSSVPVIAIRIGDMMNVLPYFYLVSLNSSQSLRYIGLLGILILMTIHKFIAFMFFFPIFNLT